MKYFLLASLFLVSSAFAQSVTWAPYAAVPLDRMSTILMALLFVFLSAWFMKKATKPAQQLFIAVAMITGAFQYTTHLYAPYSTVDMSGSDTKHFTCGEPQLLNAQEKLSVTGVSGTDCEFFNGYSAPQLRTAVTPNCDITNPTTYNAVFESGYQCILYTRSTVAD